jgi:hypothetical protein
VTSASLSPRPLPLPHRAARTHPCRPHLAPYRSSTRTRHVHVQLKPRHRRNKLIARLHRRPHLLLMRQKRLERPDERHLHRLHQVGRLLEQHQPRAVHFCAPRRVQALLQQRHPYRYRVPERAVQFWVREDAQAVEPHLVVVGCLRQALTYERDDAGKDDGRGGGGAGDERHCARGERVERDKSYEPSLVSRGRV